MRKRKPFNPEKYPCTNCQDKENCNKISNIKSCRSLTRSRYHLLKLLEMTEVGEPVSNPCKKCVVSIVCKMKSFNHSYHEKECPYLNYYTYYNKILELKKDVNRESSITIKRVVEGYIKGKQNNDLI